MQRILFATIALVLAANSAQAADFSRRYALGGYSWAGLYLGANIGYGWATTETGVTLGGTAISASERLEGPTGGVQLGYNWQAGALVLGVEGDFQASGQEHRFSTVSGGVTVQESDKIPWFGTVRGRIGVAFDQWLIYGTGGLAVGAVKSTVATTSGGVTTTINGSEPQAGWTLGAGIETALWSSAWTARIEYLHIDGLDVSTTTLGVTTRREVNNNVVRLGVNYRF